MPGASEVSVRDVALAGLRIDEASIEKVPKKFWTERDLACGFTRVRMVWLKKIHLAMFVQLLAEE